jgi:hypothetical protein
MGPRQKLIALALAAAGAAALFGLVPPIAARLGQTGPAAMEGAMLAPYRFLFIVLGAGFVIAGWVETSRARPPAPRRDRILLWLAVLTMGLAGLAPL